MSTAAARALQRLGAVSTAAELVDFHARHKYLLMAHGPDRLRALGRIVADVKGLGLDAALALYRAELADTLSREPTTGGHANALEHMAGYFEAPRRREFVTLLADFRAGSATLDELLDILRDWADRYDQKYILSQHYLTDSRSG